jgi:hypothetical protein
MTGPLPQGWVIVAAVTHPMDGEPGVVVRPPNGLECFWSANGAVRSLPWRWREHIPDAAGLAIARVWQRYLELSRAPGEAGGD